MLEDGKARGGLDDRHLSAADMLTAAEQSGIATVLRLVDDDVGFEPVSVTVGWLADHRVPDHGTFVLQVNGETFLAPARVLLTALERVLPAAARERPS